MSVLCLAPNAVRSRASDSPTALAELDRLLREPALVSVSGGIPTDFASSDGGTTIIHASRPDGADIEIALLGLDSRIGGGGSLEHPQAIIDLDAWLHDLRDQIISEGQDWFGELPSVRVAPQVGG